MAVCWVENSLVVIVELSTLTLVVELSLWLVVEWSLCNTDPFAVKDPTLPIMGGEDIERKGRGRSS